MCGKDEERHVGNGLCHGCFNRQHVAKWREKKREEGTLSQFVKGWQKKNK
jgi:hypothetical protein